MIHDQKTGLSLCRSSSCHSFSLRLCHLTVCFLICFTALCLLCQIKLSLININSSLPRSHSDLVPEPMPGDGQQSEHRFLLVPKHKIWQ